jgi:hypothetical protein
MNTRSPLQTKPTSSFTPVSSRLLQRKCACGGSAGLTGKCSECENKRLTLQRRATGQSEPDKVPPIVHEVLRSPGQPLEQGNRALMESRFGHDFSQVRVHTDEKAAESARAVDASAYTVGMDEANKKPTPNGFTSRLEHYHYPFLATIRRDDRLHSSDSKDNKQESTRQLPIEPLSSILDTDEISSDEIDVDLMLAQPEQTPLVESIREPEEGESIQLPDIIIPSIADIELADTVASSLTYNPSVTQGGTVPSRDFGITKPFTHSLTGITVTKTSGTFRVKATVDNPIKFQVRDSTGPKGQLDIESASDSDITKANYTTVASDLTPDMSTLNGKPPRHNFWARDLTLIHERFHADESVVNGRSGVTSAQNWLNTQMASSVVDVNNLLQKVPGRVTATVRAGMAMPGREERAYGFGASRYRDRANAIKARGDFGLYNSTPGDYPSPGDYPVLPPAGSDTAYA